MSNIDPISIVSSNLDQYSKFEAESFRQDVQGDKIKYSDPLKSSINDAHGNVSDSDEDGELGPSPYMALTDSTDDKMVGFIIIILKR